MGRCSGRFERIDGVSFFTIHHGRIAHAWTLEDTFARMQQLGLLTSDADPANLEAPVSPQAHTHQLAHQGADLAAAMVACFA